jgi:hypothetical protein
MAAHLVIEIPEGGDGAQPKCEIGKVTVAEGTCARAEVEGTGRKYAVLEGVTEVGVASVQEGHVYNIEVEKLRCPVSKNTCETVNKAK